MSFYDFNIGLHIERFVKKELLKPIQKAWINTLLKPLSVLHSILLLRFWDGDNSPKYNPAVAYTVGDTVRFRNKIFLCVIDTTMGQVPSAIPSVGGTPSGYTNYATLAALQAAYSAAFPTDTTGMSYSTVADPLFNNANNNDNVLSNKL